jgi:hypothetical protein
VSAEKMKTVCAEASAGGSFFALCQHPLPLLAEAERFAEVNNKTPDTSNWDSKYPAFACE